MGTPFLDHIPACGWITLSWWPDENVNGLPAIRCVDGTRDVTDLRANAAAAVTLSVGGTARDAGATRWMAEWPPRSVSEQVLVVLKLSVLGGPLDLHGLSRSA